MDKPQGWTSHDVVAKMRRLAGTRKVGHAGTLDPMATGVLVLGINRATRLLTYIVGTSKTYTTTIRLGQSTITDDAEGELTTSNTTAAVTEAQLLAGVAELTGVIQQVPSSVSAIKVNGERSYARVRAGQDVQLAARTVTIERFEVQSWQRLEIDGQQIIDLEATVECSSGTYIRALARDLGQKLGVGGHLTELRRTAVGPYRIDQARTLEQAAVELELLDISAAARALMPVRELTEEETTELSFGRRIAATDQVHSAEQPVAAFGPDGTLVALLEDPGSAGKHAKAILVFAAAGEQQPSAAEVKERK